MGVKRRRKKHHSYEKRQLQPFHSELDMDLVEALKDYRRKTQPTPKHTYCLRSYSTTIFK